MIWYKIINTPLGNVVLGGRGGRICFCHFALPSLEAVLQRVEEDYPGEAIGEETAGKEYSLQTLSQCSEIYSFGVCLPYRCRSVVLEVHSHIHDAAERRHLC